MPPPLLFLSTILKSSKVAVNDSVSRLVDSFSADFVYGVSEGKVLTGKHLFAPLYEKCPYSDFSGPYFPVFSPNARKYGPEKL